ncbi:MAG: type II toxin-antitoxin system VapC family toxin [Coriobacteriaceae bacterium]|nr:type II toxin-antitoxin system VapC family toxin [Coriobacteriaceae bacterium]
MSVIVDETVLLRYLLDDDPYQSPRAAELIATGEVRIYPEIITRTVVTLRDVYDVPRPEIARAMTALLDDVLVNEPTVCALAIRIFGRMQMDFTDCLLVARTAIYGDDIKSFGKPIIQGVADYQAARGGDGTGGHGARDDGSSEGDRGGRGDGSSTAARGGRPGSTDRTIDRLRAAGNRRR